MSTDPVLVDARCRWCGSTHVVRIDARDAEPGNEVKMAHVTGRKACGEYTAHRVRSRLDGVNKNGDTP